jgi:hypothetical protein
MNVNDAYRIIIDDSRVMFQIIASHTDDSRGVIYNCKMFKVKATGAYPSHLLVGIRLGWKSLSETNAQAYYKR